MTANVIHNPDNVDRFDRLRKELDRQKWVPDIQMWPAVFLDKPYRGIMEAHKQIVRHAKEGEMPFVWIMEDDIRIPNIYGLEFFVEQRPDDFDIYLGGIYAGGILPNGAVKNFSGLHCYMVHERFYDTFLSVPDNTHLDRALRGKGKYVVCQPFAAIQYNGYSENTGQIENYDHWLKKYKIYGL